MPFSKQTLHNILSFCELYVSFLTVVTTVVVVIIVGPFSILSSAIIVLLLLRLGLLVWLSTELLEVVIVVMSSLVEVEVKSACGVMLTEKEEKMLTEKNTHTHA